MQNNAQRDLEALLLDLDAPFEKRLITKEEPNQVLNKRAIFEYAIRSSARTARLLQVPFLFCHRQTHRNATGLDTLIRGRTGQLRQLREGRLKKDGDTLSLDNCCCEGVL